MTRQLFRRQETDFIRERKLNFSRVVGLIVRGHKFSLQNALNKVFSQLEEVAQVPTASAYTQARAKLRAEVFVHLNEIVGGQFYESEGENLRLWKGHRVLAADGMVLSLPDNPATRREFTVQTNQHAEGTCVQALTVVLSDVLNDVGLAALIDKRQGERKLLEQSEIWGMIGAQDVLVLDRNFADYSLLAQAAAEQRKIVVRLPRGRFKAAREFWESAAAETLIEIECPATARSAVRANGWPECLTMRLVRVMLESGETEVLATNLLDSQQYEAREFKRVYGWRWREETYFGRLKGIFEIERFSGKSVHSIKQDFYAVVFLASLEAVLGKRDEQTLAAKSGSNKNGAYQRNHAVGYLALVERVVWLLLSDKDIEQVLGELHHLFRTNPLQARTGRQNERNKRLRYAQKLRHHKYKKRALA